MALSRLSLPKSSHQVAAPKLLLMNGFLDITRPGAHGEAKDVRGGIGVLARVFRHPGTKMQVQTTSPAAAESAASTPAESEKRSSLGSVRLYHPKRRSNSGRVMCRSLRYYTMSYYTILYNPMLHSTILYDPITYSTILYLYYTILCCILLNYTILCCILLYYAVLNYTILYYTWRLRGGREKSCELEREILLGRDEDRPGSSKPRCSYFCLV